MGESADLRSLDALVEFRADLSAFSAAARDALATARHRARRGLDELTHDYISAWRGALKRRQEEVATARAALARVKWDRASGGRRDIVEPKKALDLAQAKVAEAEEKLEAIRGWARKVERALVEFEGPTQALAELVEGTIPPPVAVLDGHIERIRAYLSTAPPSAPSLAKASVELPARTGEPHQAGPPDSLTPTSIPGEATRHSLSGGAGTNPSNDKNEEQPA